MYYVVALALQYDLTSNITMLGLLKGEKENLSFACYGLEFWLPWWPKRCEYHF